MHQRRGGRITSVAATLFALMVTLALVLPGTTAEAQAAQVRAGGPDIGKLSGSELQGGQACPGTLIEHRAIANNNGTVLGWLDLYWDGTNNCAETVSSSITWGTRKEMGVSIQSCLTSDAQDGTCDGPIADQDDDIGQFSYYAGPASVNGTRYCVGASGWLVWNGNTHSVNTPGPWGHCG